MRTLLGLDDRVLQTLLVASRERRCIPWIGLPSRREGDRLEDLVDGVGESRERRGDLGDLESIYDAAVGKKGS